MKIWRVCLATVGGLLVLSWQGAAQIPGDEFVQGVLRQLRTDDEYPDPPTCSAGKLTVCVGCKKIKICIGAANDEDNPKQFCPAGKEHCNSNEGGCSNIPDPREDCPASTTDFTCTTTGMLPNPYSCDGYYYCENVGGIGDPYACPNGYNYNSKVELCQRAIGGFGGCQTINCTGVTAIFNPYPENPQYFYYCKANPEDDTAPLEPIMFSCGEGASFDVKEGRCVFRCPREGNFEKKGSPASYYQCFFSGGRLVSREKQCPIEGQVYDDKKKTCLTKATSDTYRKQVFSG